MSGRIEIRKQFTFDAAHYFEHMPESHGYGRVHGHSFLAEVTLSGVPDEASGWVADFGAVETALLALREELDHRLLNEVPGLEKPSLENMAMWIAKRLAPGFPNLTAVTVSRPSCGESARFVVSD